MTDSTLALGLAAAALLAVAAVGLGYSRGRVDSIEDYIVARDTAGGGVLTATLIATGMGVWILFSPAEAGAAFGGLPAVVGYAVGSALPLVGFVFVGSRVRDLVPEGHSLTEFAAARYGPTLYAYVLCVAVAYMVTFLAAEMTGVATALALVADVPTWGTAVLVGGVAVVYTAYGGLVASMVTDAGQTLLILPLLAIGFVAAVLSLGGASEVHGTVVAANPSLLDPGYLPGLEFGAYVTLAVLGANMLHQGYWQRVYAAADERTMRRSFALAAIAVVPMVFLAGLFGVVAAGLGLVGEAGPASAAFFLVLERTVPGWVVTCAVVLAVLLVASSADTLFNALASLVTADLPRLLDDPSPRTLRASARGLTLLAGVAAVAVGAQGYSVLTLFLTADLLAVATFLPFLHGLYSPRPTGRGALVACLAGLAVGVALFPPFHAALGGASASALPAPSFLRAFLGAAVVSGGVSVVAARVAGGRFDLTRLDSEIRALDDGPTALADGGRPSGSDGEVRSK